MSNSTSSDRLGQWDEDSNRPHKKRKYSQTRSETNVIEDDADSSSKRNRSILRKPESDSWVVARYLGSDSNASVYLALRTTEEGEDDLPPRMAIKSNEFSESAYLMIEEKFLHRLEGPYIVSCYGHEITEEKNEQKKYFNTILDYCPGQTLEKQIKSHREGLPIDDVKRFASDILRGLKCIHGEEIIHRDIKPKNILLKPLNSLFAKYGYNNAKISGLGNALEKKRIDDGENWNHTSGTARFMSPELIRDKVLDYGADVWAFGCTVLEMLTGERVWGEYGELDWESWVTVIGKSGLVPTIPDYLSEEARDFLRKCLERDPARRWSVDSLINHEFLYDEVEAEIEADEANLNALEMLYVLV
ncbi:PREDICTED: mitogen-activated protein kinase kinase 9-like [Camelina sativa]|uniref:Mitogen-activated protein kinase kinase 9-like n=1 Tax=Camelina sativa TaxID=90675 RepID=A0ABM0V626_CAMSA|nr:PREDICTED: mitogen-activated protein kinase kinase 9-like [Camelina sativa]